MSSWFRVGSIYKICEDSLRFPGISRIRQVEFRTIAKYSLIRKIQIFHYRDGVSCFQIDSTGFKQDFLLATIQKFYTEDEYDMPFLVSTTYRLYSSTPALFNKFISMLQYLNQQQEYASFPGELLTEFNLIFNFILTNNPESVSVQQHTIPEFKSFNSYTNPARENSYELFDLFRSNLYVHNPDLFLIILIRLLVSGEDPNRRRPGTRGTPIHIATMCVPGTKVLGILLKYGGDPFTRDNGSFFASAIETAHEKGNFEKLDMMIAAFSKPEKQLTVKIIASDLQFENNQIVTRFVLSNGKVIITHLKCNQDLSQDEIEWIVNGSAKSLYKADDPKKENLKQEVLRDVMSNNKIVEMITDGDSIVGFNLFDIILSRKHANRIYLHFNLSLLLPAYRGSSFMVPLDFRLAFALQVIKQDFMVGVFYLSIHINSYRKACGLHIPKYQPDDMDEEIHELLAMIYENQYTYVHNGLVCYVTGESMVEGTATPTQESDFDRRFFFMYLLGLDQANSTASRAVPTLFKIGSGELEEYAEQCRRIGLDLASHIDRLAYLLPPLLLKALQVRPKTEFTAPKSTEGFSDSRFLFWQGKKNSVRQYAHIPHRVAKY